MKAYSLFFLFSILLFSACTHQEKNNEIDAPSANSKIIGTWKLVHNEIKENDSSQVRDLSQVEFVKIINNTHFAFFNQNLEDIEKSYSGGGSYTFDGEKYVETLSYIKSAAFKDHVFTFTLEFKGDTLIQHGLEEVADANIKRYITEKYVKI